ncbi:MULTISPECIES: beta strand repeat-containing protein [Amycolatopsis]|uniref:Beta strand repeat-containing protein n=1 Tax=Amycolatopsis albidoflavus TaxID=102226 RepID=A0ABW5IBB5_9PSEU
MHIWVKRGMQTALVSGGLFVLGTGVASAAESPDAPANPIDAGVTVPIDIGDNVLGTPAGQTKLPGYQGEVSTKTLTNPLQQALKPKTSSAAKPATSAAPAAAKPTQKTAAKAAPSKAAPPSDPLRGNRANAELAVPVQIAGNAFAAGGPAEVDGSNHHQTYRNDHDITTSGAGTPLGGNVVDARWAVPVQFANNAISWAGAARTKGGRAEQTTSTTGSDTTDGRGGTGSGNVLAGQWATPLQVTGNAASWGGSAQTTDSQAHNTTSSGGPISSAGKDGTLAGNVGAAPLAFPWEFNGNAPTWGGVSTVDSSDTTDTVTAGGTKEGINHIPSYVQTNGDRGTGSGNIVQPQGAGIANVASVAAAWAGKSSTGGVHGSPLPDPVPLPGYPFPTGNPLTGGINPAAPTPTGQPTRPDGSPLWPVPIPSPQPVSPAHAPKSASSSKSTVTSGGFSSTSAKDGTGSGNIADAPLAVPAEVFGVAGNWGLESYAGHDNTSDVKSGSGTYSNGNGGKLSGNLVSEPVAASPDVFGSGASWIGNSYGQATNTKNVQAGGYDGTQGNNSEGSGNIVTAPAALPAEVFGVGGSWIGQGVGVADEHKKVTAGGDGNTNDDNGKLSSNVIAAPLSAPTQVFGVGAAWIGRGVGEASNHTDSKAGGDYHGTGALGTVAGNIAQAPISQVTQVDGDGAAWGGYGQGVSDNTTNSRAGGKNLADGRGGTLAGNVVNAPSAGTAGVFGVAPAWIGRVTGDATNNTTSTAGGDTHTAGDRGQLAGDVVSAEALPIAQVFGDSAAWAGMVDGSAVNHTRDTSGGDITSSGTGTSGVVQDVPTSEVAQVFGDSAVWGGVANAYGDNVTHGNSGGHVVTTGQHNQTPVGAVGQTYGVHPALLGQATSIVPENVTQVVDGDTPAQLDLPLSPSALPANGIPTLPGLPG